MHGGRQKKCHVRHPTFSLVCRFGFNGWVGIVVIKSYCFAIFLVIEPPELSCLPLRVAASEPMGGFVPVQLSPSLEAPIHLELRKGTATVTVNWPIASAAACGAWLREWLG